MSRQLTMALVGLLGLPLALVACALPDPLPSSADSGYQQPKTDSRSAKADAPQSGADAHKNLDASPVITLDGGVNGGDAGMDGPPQMPDGGWSGDAKVQEGGTVPDAKTTDAKIPEAGTGADGHLIDGRTGG